MNQYLQFWKKIVLSDVKKAAKPKFAIARKPILCILMLADVAKLMVFVKTLNILILTRIVVMNNPQYLDLVFKKKSGQGKTIGSVCEKNHNFKQISFPLQLC